MSIDHMTCLNHDCHRYTQIQFPDRDSITKRPVPTQPTPTDGVVPLSEIGKLFISLMSYTFFVLQLNN